MFILDRNIDIEKRTPIGLGCDPVFHAVWGHSFVVGASFPNTISPNLSGCGGYTVGRLGTIVPWQYTTFILQYTGTRAPMILVLVNTAHSHS